MTTNEDLIQLLESLDPNTYLEVSIRTGPKRSLLARSRSTFMQPQNTLEEDRVQVAKLIQFVRDFADEFERQAQGENILRVRQEFGDDVQ